MNSIMLLYFSGQNSLHPIVSAGVSWSGNYFSFSDTWDKCGGHCKAFHYHFEKEGCQYPSYLSGSHEKSKDHRLYTVYFSIPGTSLFSLSLSLSLSHRMYICTHIYLHACMHVFTCGLNMIRRHFLVNNLNPAYFVLGYANL